MSNETKSKVTIYTDGACSGNPGVGGWAAILIAGAYQKEIYGSHPNSTNNRMELQAVIEAFKALNRPCVVDVYSDSAYVINAFKQNWIDNWLKNGWKNAAGQTVSNKDLWQELLELVNSHTVTWHKVKGHSDNPYNNRCDDLAVQAVKDFKSENP